MTTVQIGPFADKLTTPIEMPGRMRLGAHRPQTFGDHRSEHRHPATDRLVGDIDTAFGEQFLGISEGQVKRRKCQIACWMISGGKR